MSGVGVQPAVHRTVSTSHRRNRQVENLPDGGCVGTIPEHVALKEIPEPVSSEVRTAVTD